MSDTFSRRRLKRVLAKVGRVELLAPLCECEECRARVEITSSHYLSCPNGHGRLVNPFEFAVRVNEAIVAARRRRLPAIKGVRRIMLGESE